EPKGVAFGESERLVYAEIDAKEALAAEVVALTGFARVGQTEEAGRVSGAEVKCERLTVDESELLLGVAGRDGFAFQLEVGVVGAAGIHAEREAAGPAVDAADLPAANRRIGEAIPSRAPLAAMPKGHVINPIGVDLVASVEVGGTPELLGIPGI